MKMWRDDGRMLRGKLWFALLWTAISAFAIWTVIHEPLPGDEWLLLLVGLLVFSSLALLLDVLVRFVHARKVDAPPPDS